MTFGDPGAWGASEPAGVLAGVLSAVLCGAAGLLVPALAARLPGPAYADLAAHPVRARTAATVSAVAGGLVGLALGWTWALPSVLVLVPVGVALAMVDLRTRLLPKVVVLPLTAVVVALVLLAAALERDPDALLRAGVGLVAARTVYWLLWRVRSTGLGFGDVRLAAPLGAALGQLGWGQLVVGVYAGFLVFGLPGLLLAAARRDRAMLRTAYPFGPAMLLGALVGVLVGEPVLAALLGDRLAAG
jgi:leader peptidase (prepilin peptidase)/N-methyltransferase